MNENKFHLFKFGGYKEPVTKYLGDTQTEQTKIKKNVCVTIYQKNLQLPMTGNLCDKNSLNTVFMNFF